MTESRQGKVLIVDDNVQVLNSLKFFLEDFFDLIVTTNNPDEIMELIVREKFDIIMLDMNFGPGKISGNEGFYWLSEILRIDPMAVVVYITAYGNVEMAVRAIKLGATDFILKPWDNFKLLATLQSAYSLRKTKLKVRMLRQNQKYISESFAQDHTLIRGHSEAMQIVFRQVSKVASTDANILITGENGTGKEIIAREIHRLSKRRDEIFLRVDMGAVAESLFESELFGHVKGAFTDAREDRTGKIESASGGTLFLDEIGNTSIAMQTKLLSVLQNREIYPLGSNKSIPIDVRFICATNKDLVSMISDSSFREDLYYRINTVHLNIPPLRERIDDIPMLVQTFMNYYKAKYAKPKIRIYPDVLRKLQEYTWPGNIRELQHAIERAVILGGPGVISLSDILSEKGRHSFSHDHHGSGTLEEVEKNAIISILEKNKGNIARTARELKIGRQTLYNKLRKYNL